MKSKKLNIGCGKDIKKGWINLDLIKAPGVDVVHNLEKTPYPFKDNSFDEIYASHIIEHLNNPEIFIKELCRIGKNGCKILIKTPHFSCGPLSWGDLTHKRTFSSLAFHNYEKSNKELGLKSLASSKEMLFDVRVKLRFGVLHRLLGLSFLFNRKISFYESFFAYIFPAREIIFELIVIK